MVNIYERLTAQVEAKVNAGYVDEQVLSKFIPENLEYIGIEKWMHKNLSALPEAATHAAGFNPSVATLNAEEFGHKVFTVDEKIEMNEKDWAFAEANGISSIGVELLGKQVGKQASKFLFTARDGSSTIGNLVEGNTNCITATGDGTISSPLAVTEASAGAWSTWANQNTDVTAIIANHENKNYNLATSLLWYPKCAAKAMKRHGANTLEHSAIEHFANSGIAGVVSTPDLYLPTAATAAPVIGAFDLYLIDMSQIKIGYTRQQRTRVIAPYGNVRNTTVECEVWFVPYMIPQLMPDGNFYKGVTRITAINGA